MAGASAQEIRHAVVSGPVIAYGLTRPYAAYIAADLALAGAQQDPAGAPAVIAVVADDAIGRELAEDITFFAGEARAGQADAAPAALLIPAIDTSPYADLRPDRQALGDRMAALFRLAKGGPLASRVVVVSALSLIRRVIPQRELLHRSGELRQGGEIDRDGLAQKLVAAGYLRSTVVEDPGTFAVRGEVVDMFTPLYRYPVRVELFGDTIESLRFFDPDTQRTLRQTDVVYLHPVRETISTSGSDVKKRVLEAADLANHPSKATRYLLDQIESGEEFIGLENITPAFHARLDPLWSYLNHPERPAPIWLVIDPDAVMRAAKDELDIAEPRYAERVASGRIAFAPGAHYVSQDELASALAGAARRLEARTLEVYGEGGTEGGLALATAAEAQAGAAGAKPRVMRFAIDNNHNLRADLERARRQSAEELIQPLANALARWRKDAWRVAVAAGSTGRAQQLMALLADYNCPALLADDLAQCEPGGPVLVSTGTLSAGFAVAQTRLALLSADDIFGPRRRTSAKQKAAAKRARAALMGGSADFARLEPGDYLVHDLHGVGLYKGMVKLPATRSGPEIDFLQLEYLGGQLYVPIYRLGEVQRYVGAEGLTPRLDKLGGITWQKTRRKISEQVRALAEELLQIYAQRAALPGHAFPPPDNLFHEFEATFPFDETPDQQKAIDEVIADMEKSRPMDRLVCGDVGYGKTEVALRAVFKAVLGGKQAALLAPTTVLVEQHYQTMRERFAGWPITIAKLSRFQSRAEQTATVKALASGGIDAVVGTHRVLSNDVRFKDLGLLVIDEEQRFGVAHKERLRRVRTQVDVLTLTATPIPRTLHLAMTGLRDLSIIATPPADRRAIRTFVAREDDSVLREAICRELGRGGQVFFVCPRIGGGVIESPGQTQDKPKQRRPTRERSLEEWAEHLRTLVPEARVAVGHGQMKPEQLEKIMVGFVAGDYDILVSTTIVESGLDIARANTMFIARADCFGLAQLYQLRGRIGRSSQRAFCYLMVPPLETLSTDTRRRLETLQRFTELGAGFQIASHDLEIRGGGELLGDKQSGAIAAVGFETYVRMLEEAVAELRGHESPELRRARDPELNVDTPGYIPDDYVPDTGQRLELYKRLADAEDEDEIRLVLDEICDRYGALPAEVIHLGELMAVKVHARALRAQSVEVTAARLVLALAEDTPLKADAIALLLRKKGSPYKLTQDMRLLRTFGTQEGHSALLAAKQCLLELIACAT